ncbi:phr [Symbiodinium natans]|uniref:Phr protein n=1 Tax=Symbiodinium natans TaxID=878477 RepID=A0A812HAH0_9DINO|nr:phr [Symbiodinium natans]
MLKDALGMAMASLNVDKPQASWNMRGAWLLQTSSTSCAPGEACYADQLRLTILLFVLVGAIASMLCAFGFFREDKDELLTPLTPQLVVKKEERLVLQLPFDSKEDNFLVTKVNGDIFCQVESKWPDPFREGSKAPEVEVRLSSAKSQPLTMVSTVVDRNFVMASHAFSLCRNHSKDEPFAFVTPEQPENPRRYFVRHRMGYPLLSLDGDFGAEGGRINIRGLNKDNYQICGLENTDSGESQCFVLQHIDAGLVLGALLAVRLHIRHYRYH